MLAAVLERFEDTHEFILATPDGRVPTLDINGLALEMEGDEVVATLDGLPEQRWHLIADVIARYRSLSDAFSLADLDFMYAPGGHAPMVDFHDNPVVGELLHALRENDVPVGLICHAPVAMTSAKYRLGQDEDGGTLVGEDHAFRGARVTTVP